MIADLRETAARFTEWAAANLRKKAEGGYERAYPGLIPDAFALAAGYLAEHPADEAEPVTPERLHRLGLEVCDLTWHGNGPDQAYLYPQQDDPPIGFRNQDGWFAFLLTADGFDGSESFLAATPTMGHVRRLFAALNYTPKGIDPCPPR